MNIGLQEEYFWAVLRDATGVERTVNGSRCSNQLIANVGSPLYPTSRLYHHSLHHVHRIQPVLSLPILKKTFSCTKSTYRSHLKVGLFIALNSTISTETLESWRLKLTSSSSPSNEVISWIFWTARDVLYLSHSRHPILVAPCAQDSKQCPHNFSTEFQ
jgi:hypothetical protein